MLLLITTDTPANTTANINISIANHTAPTIYDTATNHTLKACTTITTAASVVLVPLEQMGVNFLAQGHLSRGN